MSQEAAHAHFEVSHYIKIWGILVVLLVISVMGPMLNVPMLTLITAFGIAIVKALMVAGNFMHLKIEIRYIWYLLLGGLFALFVLFAGLAPDIMKNQGENWLDCMVTKSCVQQRL